jgi:stress-induced morphogen
MGIDTKALEDAIRNAVEGITHLEIKDQSSGCGENYAVLIVSEVSSHLPPS